MLTQFSQSHSYVSSLLNTRISEELPSKSFNFNLRQVRSDDSPSMMLGGVNVTNSSFSSNESGEIAITGRTTVRNKISWFYGSGNRVIPASLSTHYYIKY